MTSQLQEVEKPVKSNFLANAVSITVNAVAMFAKNHILCCAVIPAAVTMLGSGAAAAMETPLAEGLTAVLMPPLVTLGLMAGEQAINNARAKKTQSPCAHDACSHRKNLFTRNRVLTRLALGYACYAASSLFMPDDGHEHNEHNHDRKENHFLYDNSVGMVYTPLPTP